MKIMIVTDLSNRPMCYDSDSEDDTCQYCICGKPSSCGMIACDDEQCTWHRYGGINKSVSIRVPIQFP